MALCVCVKRLPTQHILNKFISLTKKNEKSGGYCTLLVNFEARAFVPTYAEN